MSYSTYLTFYALTKVDGQREVLKQQHPVLFKLAHIKQLLDQLEPIDNKIEQKVKHVMMNKDKSTKSQAKKKAGIDQQSESDLEDYDEEMEEDLED